MLVARTKRGGEALDSKDTQRPPNMQLAQRQVEGLPMRPILESVVHAIVGRSVAPNEPLMEVLHSSDFSHAFHDIPPNSLFSCELHSPCSLSVHASHSCSTLTRKAWTAMHMWHPPRENIPLPCCLQSPTLANCWTTCTGCETWVAQRQI